MIYKKAKTYTKAFLFIMLTAGIIFLLSGCGMGEKNEKRLFEAMKENGLIDLPCDYEDYDEVHSQSQSPVPAVITYYDYHQNGKIYTVDYSSIIVGKDDSVYQVRVTTKTEEESDTSVYYFEKDTFEFREKKY